MVNNVSTGILLRNLLVFSVHTLTFAWIIVIKGISQGKLPVSKMFVLNAHHGCTLLDPWTAVLAPYSVLINIFFYFKLLPQLQVSKSAPMMQILFPPSSWNREAVTSWPLVTAPQIHHWQQNKTKINKTKHKNPQAEHKQTNKTKQTHFSQSSNMLYLLHSLLEGFPVLLDKALTNHKTPIITYP